MNCSDWKCVVWLEYGIFWLLPNLIKLNFPETCEVVGKEGKKVVVGRQQSGVSLVMITNGRDYAVNFFFYQIQILHIRNILQRNSQPIFFYYIRIANELCTEIINHNIVKQLIAQSELLCTIIIFNSFKYDAIQIS